METSGICFSQEEFTPNDVTDSEVSNSDTTITKKPTSNNGLKDVIEPFAFPEEESSKAEAELDAMIEEEEERPKVKSITLKRQAKLSFLPIKLVDLNSQEPMERDRTSSENVSISLRQRRR